MTDDESHARYPVTSVSRALKVIRMITERRVVRVHEVASSLGVAQSSAHRILSTLVDDGFVSRDPDSREY